MIRETFRKVASFFRKTPKSMEPASTTKFFEKKFDTTEQDKWQAPVTKSNWISAKEKRHRRAVNAMQKASRIVNR